MAQGHFWAYDSSLCALKGQKPQRLSDDTKPLPSPETERSRSSSQITTGQ